MTSSSDAGSLKRGVAFLKLLATGGVRGCPLSELAEKSGVPHPSAHRILKQLIAERLVVHDAQTHRYRLGPLARSEEHTSELQSQSNLVCRLLLEKKKKTHAGTPPQN